MNKVLMISPHFDDAILSAGQFMADRPETFVVTVFAGLPKDPDETTTDYDKKCGFANAKEAWSARWVENAAACAILQADWMNLDFPDSQYGEEVTVDQIRDNLQAIIDEDWYEAIYAPLGLDHPDHIKVSEAVRQLIFPRKIYFWEDLPVRVLNPSEAVDRARRMGLSFENSPSTTHEKMAKKIRALSCYTSQMGTGILDPYLMYVPERFWRVQ